MFQYDMDAPTNLYQTQKLCMTLKCESLSKKNAAQIHILTIICRKFHGSSSHSLLKFMLFATLLDIITFSITEH